MSTPDQQRTLFRMRAAVEDMIAAAEAGGARVGFAVDATRVARGPGSCLYRVDPPPDARLTEDAPIRLSAGDRATAGRLGPVADESCLLETDVDLGPRVLGGRLVVDNVAPVRGLLDRLDALAGDWPPPARPRAGGSTTGPVTCCPPRSGNAGQRCSRRRARTPARCSPACWTGS